MSNLRMNGAVIPVPQHALRAWTGTALNLRFLLFQITCILIYIWPGISVLSFHHFFFTSCFECRIFKSDRLPPKYPVSTVTGLVLGDLRVTAEHVPHCTKPNLATTILSARPLWHGRMSQWWLVAKREPAGRTVSRRQREVCRRDVRHTFLKMNAQDNARTGRDYCCVGSNRRRKEKCGGHRIICDRRNYGLFWTIFEDLKESRNEVFFFSSNTQVITVF